MKKIADQFYWIQKEKILCRISLSWKTQRNFAKQYQWLIFLYKLSCSLCILFKRLGKCDENLLKKNKYILFSYWCERIKKIKFIFKHFWKIKFLIGTHGMIPLLFTSILAKNCLTALILVSDYQVINWNLIFRLLIWFYFHI